ncbi:MAG: hypothetical protein WA869_09505, partial [Alloacidobacterium sp.]
EKTVMTVEEIKDEIRSIQRRRDLESHGSERVLACTADAIHVLQYCSRLNMPNLVSSSHIGLSP